MLELFVRLQSLMATREKGATAVEYGIMVALIAAVIIVAVALIGTELDRVFDFVGAELKKVVTTP